MQATTDHENGATGMDTDIAETRHSQERLRAHVQDVVARLATTNALAVQDLDDEGE